MQVNRHGTGTRPWTLGFYYMALAGHPAYTFGLAKAWAGALDDWGLVDG